MTIGKRLATLMLTALTALAATAQTETGSTTTEPLRQELPDSLGGFRHPETQAWRQAAREELRLSAPPLTSLGRGLPHGEASGATMGKGPGEALGVPAYQPVASVSLWRGATLGARGYQQAMPGLTDVATSSLVFQQDLGRLHLTAAGMANKYWMPGKSSLYTQFGFGGTVAYDLSPTLTLHAFGYYYATNPPTNAAMSPYMNTTSFGGYMDIRLNDDLGVYTGVKRYVNPMTHAWDTEPIVTPYIKLGKKSRLEFPIGNLLKTAVWGDRDNPLRWQPRPMPPRR